MKRKGSFLELPRLKLGEVCFGTAYCKGLLAQLDFFIFPVDWSLEMRYSSGSSIVVVVVVVSGYAI